MKDEMKSQILYFLLKTIETLGEIVELTKKLLKSLGAEERRVNIIIHFFYPWIHLCL